MFHFLAGLACLLAALMQLAVHRSPEIIDTRKSVTMGRRITMASLSVAAIYIFSSDPPPIASLTMGLFGLGQILYAAHNLGLDHHDGTHA